MHCVRLNVLPKTYAGSEPQFPPPVRLTFHMIVFSICYPSSFFLSQIEKQMPRVVFESSLKCWSCRGLGFSIKKSVLLHQLVGGRGIKVPESFPSHQHSLEQRSLSSGTMWSHSWVLVFSSLAKKTLKLLACFPPFYFLI